MALSNAVYRLSLSFLVFELSGRGGHPPPPPGRAKVAQTPGRVQVKTRICSSQTTFVINAELVYPFGINVV